MRPVPVICSFNKDGKIKPIYFGIEEDSVLHRIKIDAILSIFTSLTRKDTFYAGMTYQYMDKIFYKCRYTSHSMQHLVTLIYDPAKMVWYIE